MTSKLDIALNENIVVNEDFDKITRLVWQSLQISITYKDLSLMEKKEELMMHLTQFLEKYLELQLLKGKDDKLEIINFIDKMNLYRELLEVQKNSVLHSQLEKAGRSLGKKSQSAFKSKRVMK